ncbi:MAG: tyrosine-protein phosphatase, partial [Chloroflexi bacterium]|nr:tyrosine-protein phosphatase [Chloroflexota bacterium]
MLEQLIEQGKRLRWEGVHNLRDVGGYPTRDGRPTRSRVLYRSDSLHKLAPEAQRTLLDDHGVRTIIDLRRAPELERSPNVFAESAEVRYLHLPLIVEQLGGGEPAQSLEEMFRRLLDHHQPQIAAVLRAL